MGCIDHGVTKRQNTIEQLSLHSQGLITRFSFLSLATFLTVGILRQIR